MYGFEKPRYRNNNDPGKPHLHRKHPKLVRTLEQPLYCIISIVTPLS
jgi:hypothetical protein